MPLYCCVPQCGSLYGKTPNIKLHRFPSNTLLAKKWMVKIKLLKSSKWAVVCSLHFNDEDYFISYTGLRKVLKKDAYPTVNLPRRKFDKTKTNRRILKRHSGCENITNENTNLPQCANDYVCRSYNNSTQTEVIQLKNIKVQTLKLLSNTQESILFIGLTKFDIVFYTGLSFDRFEALAEFITISDKRNKFNKYLSNRDQLVLTLMKLRRNFPFQHMAKLYGLKRVIVREIFVFWLEILYIYLKNTDFWSMRFKSKNSYTAIIACSEIISNKSTLNPTLNQVLFSNYKNNHTIKYLIAIDEKGSVIFCSEAFGGGISDQQIIKESGLLEKLKPGDIILADRGFDISDVLEEKKVILNIPPFLRGKTQLSHEEIVDTRIIANRRIHVERVIGLAKFHLILSQKFSASLWPYATKIIYVANMICNFKPSIV